MVWSVAFANIFGAGICFLFARQLAKVALLRISILAPVVLVVVFVGAYQGSQHWGDLYALLAFGVLGFIMKRLRWPRPPLILGFVLGGLVERYMFISVERYGAAWLWERPVVVIMIVITVLGILSPMLRQLRERRRSGAERDRGVIGFQRQSVNTDLLFTLALLGMFVTALVISSQWDFGARLVPQVVGWTAVGLVSLYMALSLFYRRGARRAAKRDGSGQTAEQREGESDVHFDIVVDFGDLAPRTILRRALVYFAWLAIAFGLASVIGLLPAMFFFLVGFMRTLGERSWARTLTIAVAVWAFCYILFHEVLLVPWPQALVGDWFPALRANRLTNLF